MTFDDFMTTMMGSQNYDMVWSISRRKERKPDCLDKLTICCCLMHLRQRRYERNGTWENGKIGRFSTRMRIFLASRWNFLHIRNGYLCWDKQTDV